MSQTTVSRVLHDHPNVKPETREHVLRVLRETDYAPNAVARAMVTRHTGTIGVVVEDITNPFYPEIVEALSSELAACDRRMILWNSSGAGESSAVEAIQEKLVDGVVFTTATAGSVALEKAIQHGAPIVQVNRYVEEMECDRVITDNVGGGWLAAEYLIGCGHKRIGLIGGLREASTAIEREHGFRECLKQHNLMLNDGLYRSGNFSYCSAHKAMRELLELPERPSAVFCANDLTAFAALNAARTLGVTVPDDVWVVGFDDIDMASWETLDLTTVRQPTREMARVAVRLLLQRIRDPTHPPKHCRFGSELIIRGSTAHVAINGKKELLWSV